MLGALELATDGPVVEGVVPLVFDAGSEDGFIEVGG